MSLTERWEGLSPGLRRGLVLGGAVTLILAVASLLVSAPMDERGGPAGEPKRLITNLLTEADPRAIGIEGLAERLRRLESHIDQLAVSLEKLCLGKGVALECDGLIEFVGLHRGTNQVGRERCGSLCSLHPTHEVKRRSASAS